MKSLVGMEGLEERALRRMNFSHLTSGFHLVRRETVCRRWILKFAHVAFGMFRFLKQG